jgi:hypothetical protein
MLENLPVNTSQPAYEIWRQRIQQHFQTSQELKAPQPKQQVYG